MEKNAILPTYKQEVAHSSRGEQCCAAFFYFQADWK
jgi:hypothetical protein